MTYTLDTSGFTAKQLEAVDKIEDIALIYNAGLLYTIGKEDFDELRNAEPGGKVANDYCDANMVLLAAFQKVLEISEDEAMDEIVISAVEIANLALAVAEEQRRV